MAKYNIIISVSAEIVHREMRRKGIKIAEKSDAYIYDIPQNLSMVAEKPASYGTEVERK